MIRAEGVQLTFRYAAGEVAGRALLALRDEGRLLGARCPACARVLCPARSFCPTCGGATAPDLVPLGPGAVLVASTELPGRGAFGLVRPDGADGALVHRLVGLGPGGAPWAPGARVRARFGSVRTGAITDLEGFEAEGA